MLKRKKGPCRVSDCTAEALYECPRCAIRYCSAACYGRHSERCVREFSAAADERLRGVKVDEREQKEAGARLRAALERLEEEQPLVHHGLAKDVDDLVKSVAGESDSDEDSAGNGSSVGGDGDAEDIAGREGAFDGEHNEEIGDVLEGLVEEMEESEMTFEELASRLPPHMVADFHDMLRDGRMGRFLPIWRPWWIHPREEAGDVGALPPLPQDGDPPFPVAGARNAAASIIFSVADVVYGYCLVMRMHNGDWGADCKAATGLLWQVCGVLADDARHESMDGALNRCVERAARATGSEGAAVEGVADAGAVFSGRKDWLVRALWDAHMLLAAGGEGCKGRDARDAAKRRMKVGFLIAWCQRTDNAVFEGAARGIASSLHLRAEAKEEIERARRIGKEVNYANKCK